MSLAKLELITQEDEKGCGLACIAMLTGVPYWEVKELYEDTFNKDINEEGISEYEELTLLDKLGFRNSIIQYGNTCSLHPGRTFLLCVPSLNSKEGGIHRIIAQTFPEGIKVYDPSNKEKKYTEIPNCWFEVIEIVHGED